MSRPNLAIKQEWACLLNHFDTLNIEMMADPDCISGWLFHKVVSLHKSKMLFLKEIQGKYPSRERRSHNKRLRGGGIGAYLHILRAKLNARLASVEFGPMFYKNGVLNKLHNNESKGRNSFNRGGERNKRFGYFYHSDIGKIEWGFHPLLWLLLQYNTLFI